VLFFLSFWSIERIGSTENYFYVLTIERKNRQVAPKAKLWLFYVLKSFKITNLHFVDFQNSKKILLGTNFHVFRLDLIRN
jgi:hypothetical protein